MRRNRLAHQSLGIARTVIFFMVSQGNLGRRLQQRGAAAPQQLVAQRCVALHDGQFGFIEPTLFTQNVVRDPNLTNVVHGRRLQQEFLLSRRQRDFPRDQMGVMGYAQDVLPGFLVAVGRSPGQGDDGFTLSQTRVLGRLSHRVGQPGCMVDQMSAGLTQLEHVSDTRQKLNCIHRPAQKIVRARFERYVANLFFIVGSHHQNGD